MPPCCEYRQASHGAAIARARGGRVLVGGTLQVARRPPPLSLSHARAHPLTLCRARPRVVSIRPPRVVRPARLTVVHPFTAAADRPIVPSAVAARSPRQNQKNPRVFPGPAHFSPAASPGSHFSFSSWGQPNNPRSLQAYSCPGENLRGRGKRSAHKLIRRKNTRALPPRQTTRAQSVRPSVPSFSQFISTAALPSPHAHT